MKGYRSPHQYLHGSKETDVVLKIVEKCDQNNFFKELQTKMEEEVHEGLEPLDTTN